VTRTGKTERSGRSGSMAVAGWRLVGDWIVEALWEVARQVTVDSIRLSNFATEEGKVSETRD